MKKQIMKLVTYFSPRERERRLIEIYGKRYSRFEKLSETELTILFVDCKSKYEHKKNIFSFFTITFLVAILGFFFLFFRRMLDIMFLQQSLFQTEDILTVNVWCIIFAASFVSILIIILFHLQELSELNKRLLLIQEIRKKSLTPEVELLQRTIKNSKNCERFNKEDFFFKKLLCERVPLSEIPFEIRVTNDICYIFAFRASRNISKERFLQDLETMRNDIARIGDPHMKKNLKQLYSDLKSTEKYIKK